MKRKTLSSAVILPTLLLALLVSCNKTNDSSTTSELPPSVSEEPNSSNEENSSNIEESVSEKESTSNEASSSSIEESSSSQEVVKEKLATPTISLNEFKNGLVFNSLNASKIQVKVNDNPYEDASGIMFDEEEGTYNVSVIAIGDNINYLDSDVAIYTYTTVNSDITVTKTATDTASVTFTGISCMANGEKLTENEYHAKKTENVTFTVKGGFDENTKKYYVKEKSQDVSFKVKSAINYILEDANDKEAADLADEWTVKKYSSSWVDTTASVSMAKGRNDSNALVLNAWNNQTTFRFSKNYNINDAFNVISFDIKGDDIVTAKIQLMNSKSGVYTTYDIKTVSSCWANYKISMNDDNWKVNLDNKNYKLNEVLSHINAYDTSEVISYFDQFNIILSGQTANGSTTKVYMDDITFETEALGSDTTYYLDKISSSFVGSSSSINYALSKEAITTLNLTQVNKDAKEELTLTVKEITKEKNLVTYKFNADVETSITFMYKNDGASLVVVDTKGYGSSIEKGTIFSKKGQVNLDFEDGNVGNPYENNMWTQYYYGASGWVSQTKKMNSRNNPKKDSKVVNFYTGSNISYLYKYNEFNEQIGLVDYVSIDLGNYFNGAKDMDVKVSLVDSKGNKHYLIGSDKEFYKFAKTTDLVTLEKYLDAPVDVKYFQLCIKSSLNDAYLYADNLKLEFKGRKEETTPEIKKANLIIDFENLTSGKDYTSDEWTKQKYTTDWVNGGTMRVRTSPIGKSTVVNMDAGYSTTYMYTYTPKEEIGATNKISVDLGNYFNGAKEMNVKVFALDENNIKHFVIGGEKEWYTLSVTTDLETFTKEFEEEFKVKSFVVVNKSSMNGNTYLYMDNIKILNEAKTVETKKANTKLDFENLTSGKDYTSDEWTKQKYTTDWVNGGTMRVRTSPIGKSTVVNMDAGYSTTYMYTYTPKEEIGATNKISVDLGNYFNGAKEMNVKVFALDENNIKHFVIGGEKEWYTLSVTTDLETFTKEFEEEFKVKSFVVVNKSSMNGNTYLYMDNITISYTEK